MTPFASTATQNVNVNTEHTSTPTINITTPEKGNLYGMGAQIIKLPFNWNLLIGPITIRAQTSTTDDIKVKFFIDDQLESTDQNSPYEYAWWDLSLGRHTIKVELLQNSIVKDTDTVQAFKIF